jgi:group I intron endonuclease
MNNNNIKSGIYKITNKNNGKFYIGSSKNLDRRWWEHKNDLLKNKHINPKLQHAWNYHGKDAFEFTILENVEENNLFDREQFYIDAFQPHKIGYNIAEKAAGGDNFTNHPDKIAILEKMKLANSQGHMHGKTHKPESIEKQKQAAVGRFSLEWFIERNGVDKGTEKYHKRRDKLKNRKINYVHDNGLKGTRRGPMSDEDKKRISESKAAFKIRKQEFEFDLKSNEFTIQQLANKYNISNTLVKYYKRKLL